MSLTHNPAGTAPAEAAAWANEPTTAPIAGLRHPGLIAQNQACDIQLPSGPKHALIALARCRDSRSGTSTISLESIGERSGGVGDKQAGRYVEALIDLGLVAKVGRAGRCNVYKIDTEALAKAKTCKKQRPVQPVDNSNDTPDIPDTDPGHFEQPPRTFQSLTPVMDDLHSGYWYSGFSYSGGDSEAHEHAADPVEAVSPPLPIFEDLKTEQPAQPKTAVDDVLANIADKRAEQLPIGGQDIRDLIEAAAACGEMPLAVAADAVRGCLPAADAPALTPPAEPVIAPIVTPPAHPAMAVAIAPGTLAAVNAQRVRNGKEPLQRADLVELGRQATLAGIAPQTAAEWILARPSRSFFRAGYSLDTSPDPAQAAPVDEAAKAQARATADQVQDELVRRSIEAMRQGSAASVVLPASAAPITRPERASVGARPAPLQAITLRHAAPTALGSTGTGWARQAVDGFLAGEPVSRARLTNAASALGLAVRDLKAQRAAHLAAVAA